MMGLGKSQDNFGLKGRHAHSNNAPCHPKSRLFRDRIIDTRLSFRECFQLADRNVHLIVHSD